MPSHEERRQHYLSVYRPGMTRHEFAAAAGVRYDTAIQAGRRLGLVFARASWTRRVPKDPQLVARNQEIAKLVGASACTLDRIGDKFGLTRERVRQIAAGQGVRRGVCGPIVVADREDYRVICPVCGKVFSNYGKNRRQYCSISCSAVARRKHFGEHLWDAWCAWLRLGGMVGAERLSGVPAMTISRAVRSWGIKLGAGRRRDYKKGAK